MVRCPMYRKISKKELTSLIGFEITGTDTVIGIDDSNDPRVGDNPRIFAFIYKESGNNYRFRIYENDALWAVQDYDPAQPGFVAMTKARARELAEFILDDRIAKEQSGEVRDGTGVGYTPE